MIVKLEVSCKLVWKLKGGEGGRKIDDDTLDILFNNNTTNCLFL